MEFEDFATGIVLVVGTVIFVTVLLAGWGLLWSFPLMWSWNYVMPDIFGLSTITYWQMFCLYFVLSSLWKITVSGGKTK